MNSVTGPFADYVQTYLDKEAADAKARQDEYSARAERLLAEFNDDLAVWLPADLLAALAPSDDVEAVRRGNSNLCLMRRLEYKGEPGAFYYFAAARQREAPVMRLEFGDSAAYHLAADISMGYTDGSQQSAPTRKVRPATPAELGAFFYALDLRQAGVAQAERERLSNNFFYGRIYDIPTLAEMERFYTDEYVPVYGQDQRRLDAIKTISDNKAAEQQRKAERAENEAKQDAERAEYEARKVAAQAEADSIWHPFTIYRIEYGALVADGDGSAGPALDNIYSLDLEPDAQGWYRRIMGGKVTRVRIPAVVLIEQIRVETPDQARYLAVCKVTHRNGVTFFYPPDVEYAGEPDGEDQDGQGIPF